MLQGRATAAHHRAGAAMSAPSQPPDKVRAWLMLGRSRFKPICLLFVDYQNKMDAEVNVVQYEDKIKKLLEKFLQPDFVLRTDTYLNVLLSHLSGKSNGGYGEKLINMPIFMEWLLKAIQHWEGRTYLPTPTVVGFTVHLASLLSKNEARFTAFSLCSIYTRLITAFNLRNADSAPSVKLAYVNLLASFLEHKSGVQWLMATDNWQDVLEYCLSGQTIYILQEGQNFIYKLLYNSSSYNKAFCNVVVGKMMVVLTETHFTNRSAIPEVNDELLQKKLTPTLRLIGHILESCLESELFAKRDYTIPSVFLKNYHLEQNIWTVIMMGSQNHELLCDLNKVLLLSYFFGLALDAEQEFFQCKEIIKLTEDVFKLIKMYIAKNSVLNILKICHLLNYYWKLIASRLPQIDYSSDHFPLFENQVIVFQIVPVFVMAIARCNTNLGEQEDVFREEFMHKMFRIMCEHTIRVVYSFRSILQYDKNIFEIAQKSLMYIMKSRQFYHRDRAVIIFQSLTYVLRDVIDALKGKPELAEVFSKQVGFFSAHLDALATFVKDFDITWRESVETICIMNISLDFMSFPFWPPKLIVQSLKLVNLSIARFMSPNLALLVDRTSDTSMANLGVVLMGKLYDVNWEVRDSALEVVHTISSIAHTKFPSFQNMVLDSELPSLVVTMSIHDTESFVRASAIKCLQEMIKVPAFWNEVLDREDLPKKMIQILYSDPEAIVRCEAASLMCRIYEHQSFLKQINDTVNAAMQYAATSDLYWEVKANALCYWEKTICNRLSNQGMIDGSFPTVTFSKENRKIVTLTEVEIKNRLRKVLTELSKCGCLSVLVAAIKDDCDLAVAKKAVEITKKLAELLNVYAISCDVMSPNSVSPKAVMDTFNLVSSSPIASLANNVIDDIVNSRDVNLLPNMYVKNDAPICPMNGLQVKMKVITPQEFLDFIHSNNLDDLIAERSRWLNSFDDFGSLLDDILGTYEDDVNAMDCY